jgi:hypothetical protein
MAGGGRTTKTLSSSSTPSDDVLHARTGLSHDCYTASVLSSLSHGVVDAVERFPALSFPHKTRSFALFLSFLPSHHFLQPLHSLRHSRQAHLPPSHLHHLSTMFAPGLRLSITSSLPPFGSSPSRTGLSPAVQSLVTRSSPASVRFPPSFPSSPHFASSPLLTALPGPQTALKQPHQHL